jgi:hypothetical protein
MNSHLTQVLGLVVIGAWAILSAKGIKGRLLTLLTIPAFMVVGPGTGFAVGARDGNLAIRSSAATSWMILLGAVSGFGCVIRNRPSILATVVPCAYRPLRDRLCEPRRVTGVGSGMILPEPQLAGESRNSRLVDTQGSLPLGRHEQPSSVPGSMRGMVRGSFH